MYKISILLIVGFLMASCSSPNAATGPNVVVYIKYINKKGENLLNPDRTHAITEKNTNLYYLINGKKVKVYEGNLDNPKHFFIKYDSTDYYKDPSMWGYLMRVFPNTPDGQDTATTYIVYKDYPTDTLKVQYKRNNGIDVYVTKVWYNGELRWEAGHHRRRVLTITKHRSGE